MLGAFGLIIDLILILFGLELLGLALICLIFRILPGLLKGIVSLVTNPIFWIAVLVLVFLF